MLGQDILKKIRRIEIISKKRSNELFAGEYHSAFKGRGMEFSEVREYIQGDDIRFIDWNVSSRLGKFFVKQFVEERELTVILAVDISSSLNFFSGTRSKREIAAEISALISFAAMLNNDKVGLLVFTDHVEYFVPPRKGRSHLLRLIRDILTFPADGGRTSITEALIYLNKAIKKRAIIFLISDFLDSGFSKPLKICSQKHDLIAVQIFDPREQDPPRRGLFILQDSERKKDFFVDFSSKQVQQASAHRWKEHQYRLDTLFTRYDVDTIPINCQQDYDTPLIRFFLHRKKRLAR